ncbi:MAG: LysM peptidoglycan-binding domain-containing protein [Desulfitobacteriia bacterium]|jgi:hypothetical protein
MLFGKNPDHMEPGMDMSEGHFHMGPHGHCHVDPLHYCEPVRECPEVYVVKKGDTVYKIAQRYCVDWRELARFNNLCNPNLIYPGDRLFIPPRC